MCLDHEGTAPRTSAYDAAAHHRGIPHNHRHPTEHIHNIGGVHQTVSHNHPSAMYATLRPNQRQTRDGTVCMGSTTDTSFHEFVPPPPPMFGNVGGNQCPVNNPSAPCIPLKNDAEDKRSQKVSSKQNECRPVVAPKPKINGKGSEKSKEKKKRESTV
jgi:hypothetical protein